MVGEKEVQVPQNQPRIIELNIKFSRISWTSLKAKSSIKGASMKNLKSSKIGKKTQEQVKSKKMKTSDFIRLLEKSAGMGPRAGCA